MSWSWSNPSEEEALDAYQYYQGKYTDSAYQRSEYQRQEQSLCTERASAKNQIQFINSQKINFEERIRGIERIIKMLNGQGGFFAVDVPGTISKARKSLQDVDDSYRKCIRMTGGTDAASFADAFAIPTVEGDPHSAQALDEFIREKARLEEELCNLRKQLSALTELVNSLNSRINAVVDAQAALTSAMNSYAYDMNHYKGYTY